MGQEAQDLGAGEICLNFIDADGTTAGYELTLTSLISKNVTIPVIASGGAGKPEHIRDVFTEAESGCGPHRLHGSLQGIHGPWDQGVSEGKRHPGAADNLRAHSHKKNDSASSTLQYHL